MFFILHAWRQSFFTLHPSYLYALLKKSCTVFLTAFMQFALNFAWLIALDAFFSLTFGDILARASSHMNNDKSVDISFLIITLVQGVIWLLTTSSLLLLLRKNDALSPKEYFKIYFFRYIKLSFLISIASLVVLYLFIAMKITKIPHIPWTFMLGARIVEYCIIFYWLDSPIKIIDFFRSVEKATNIVFYNAPFFIVFFALFWVSDYCLYKIAQSLGIGNIRHFLLSHHSARLFENQELTVTTLKLLCIKYGVFIYEYFLISILFCFYRRTKHNHYSRSFFK